MSDRTFFQDYFFCVTSMQNYQGYFLYSIINPNPRDDFILDLVATINSIYFPFWLIFSFFVILKLTVFSLDIIFSEIFPFLVKIKEILFCQRRFGNTQLFSPIFSRLKKPYQYTFYSFGCKPITHTLNITFILSVLATNSMNLFLWTINCEKEYNRFISNFSQVFIILSGINLENFLFFICITISLFSSIKIAFFAGLGVFLVSNLSYLIIAYLSIPVDTLRFVSVVHTTVYYVLLLAASLTVLYKIYKFDNYAFNLQSFRQGRELLNIPTDEEDLIGLKLKNYVSIKDNRYCTHKFKAKKTLIVVWSLFAVTNVWSIFKNMVMVLEMAGIDVYFAAFQNWFYIACK